LVRYRFKADTRYCSFVLLGTEFCALAMALGPLRASCCVTPSQKTACPIFQSSQSSAVGLPSAKEHRSALAGWKCVQKQRPRRWNSVVRAECCLIPEAAAAFPEQNSVPQSIAHQNPPTYVKAPGRIIASKLLHLHIL
jgi:hypothetical protein